MKTSASQGWPGEHGVGGHHQIAAMRTRIPSGPVFDPAAWRGRVRGLRKPRGERRVGGHGSRAAGAARESATTVRGRGRPSKVRTWAAGRPRTVATHTAPPKIAVGCRRHRRAAPDASLPVASNAIPALEGPRPDTVLPPSVDDPTSSAGFGTRHPPPVDRVHHGRRYTTMQIRNPLPGTDSSTLALSQSGRRPTCETRTAPASGRESAPRTLRQRESLVPAPRQPTQR